MKEKYDLFENSDDWLYEDPVPSVETWNIPKEMVVQLSPVFCSSVRGTLRRKYKKGKSEVDKQPALLDAFREYNLYVLGRIP